MFNRMCSTKTSNYLIGPTADLDEMAHHQLCMSSSNALPEKITAATASGIHMPNDCFWSFKSTEVSYMIFSHTLGLFYSGCRSSWYQRGLLHSALVGARSAALPRLARLYCCTWKSFLSILSSESVMLCSMCEAIRHIKVLSNMLTLQCIANGLG